jgi:carbon storage regulator
MLILTRRIGETLRIGSDVAVTVLGIRGRQVRIGVTAPKSIPVHRDELYERIQREFSPRGAARPIRTHLNRPPAGAPPHPLPRARSL